MEREGRVVKEEEPDDNMANPFQPINNVVTEVGYHRVTYSFIRTFKLMIKMCYDDT